MHSGVTEGTGIFVSCRVTFTLYYCWVSVQDSIPALQWKHNSARLHSVCFFKIWKFNISFKYSKKYSGQITNWNGARSFWHNMVTDKIKYLFLYRTTLTGHFCWFTLGFLVCFSLLCLILLLYLGTGMFALVLACCPLVPPPLLTALSVLLHLYSATVSVFLSFEWSF